MKLPSIILYFILLPLIGSAQTGKDKSSGLQQKKNTFVFQNQRSTLQIDFCTEAMFRVRMLQSEQTLEEEEHLMVVKYNWDPVKLKVLEEAASYRIQSDLLDITVHKQTLGLMVHDKQGKLLSADQQAVDWKEEGFVVNKVLQADEHFFGFGERMDFIDQRNKKLSLNVGRGKGRPHEVGAYNVLEANYAPVPFFMSTKGYGIFLHNSFETQWDMGLSRSTSYAFGAVAGALDYYFIYGPTFPDLLDHYTDLTGKSPLLLKSALGLHVGTYSGGTWGHEDLTSDAYVIALAKKFRALGIPVDLLWLDSTWRIFGKNGGNGATSFEWRSTFQDPKSMFDSLYALNYSMVGLHLRPRLDNGEKLNLLDQARAKGLVYPEPDNKGEFVNFFDQGSVDWWWQNGVKTVADIGAKFLKTDEGSAFGGLANESDKMGPTDKQAQKLHNVFPIAYAKAPYEKFQEFNGMRGLNHTREGYAGIRRYPFIFAGDWPSEWQYFEPVIKAGLNIGLSGVGFWGHCMGGFEHVADPELYMRWVQFGMFSPIAMVFGMEHPQYKEPWQYGEEALQNFKKYDELRYQLMPYIYSASYQQYKKGIPMMRALALHYQDDPNVYTISDQYFFGNDLMICPVTTKGAKTRTVYLPEGRWYDYWTNKRYEGKQYIHITTPLDQLPIFVKAGAVIPMQAAAQYVGEKALDLLTLRVYPGAENTFELYEDDGKSLAYQQGQYNIRMIHLNSSEKEIGVAWRNQQHNFSSSNYLYRLIVKWTAENVPHEVKENGQALPHHIDPQKSPQQVGWHYDQEHKEIIIYTAADSQTDFTLSIQ